MEIIVTSRQMTAGAVLDTAFDLGLDRPKIVTVEEWAGAAAYILTFGPLAYRKTAVLRPRMTLEQVKEILLLAKAEAAAKVGKEIDPPVPIADEVAEKPEKRKAAKPRATA